MEICFSDVFENRSFGAPEETSHGCCRCGNMVSNEDSVTTPLFARKRGKTFCYIVGLSRFQFGDGAGIHDLRTSSLSPSFER